MIQDIYPHQFDNSFVCTNGICENDYIFHFNGNDLLLKHNGETLELPQKKDLAGICSEGIFLFSLNKVRCFLVRDCPEQENNELIYHPIKNRNPFVQKEIDYTSAVALHLRNWYAQHKFCGKCGTPTVNKSNERAIFCPSCQSILYPDISPAIIVAIFCDDKILLARNANFPEGFYSLVAGYVDIGETIEDAVAREVKEEVGLTLKNIRYYNSQPWPFSGSMMIGFTAEADKEQTIEIDNHEIVEAAWYSRNNLPETPLDRSIAGEIIGKFRCKEL